MDLYFTRHGKTEWNQEMRFQGREGDSPLLQESYKEIALLGQRIKEVPFTAIYTSSSKRARMTAEGIASELLITPKIICEDDLREIGLGDLEGTLIEEARREYGAVLEAMRYRPGEYDPSVFHGETFQELIRRGTTVVMSAMAREMKGPLLFVGHGSSLTATIQSLAGKPIGKLRDMGGLTNSSLSILQTPVDSFVPPFELQLWNDSSHLNK